MADHPDGYTEKHNSVPQERNEALANYHANISRGDQVLWEKKSQTVIQTAISDALTHLSCNPHAWIINPTHIYLLINGPVQRSPNQTGQAIKSRISRDLNLHIERNTYPWLTKGHHCRIIKAKNILAI